MWCEDDINNFCLFYTEEAFLTVPICTLKGLKQGGVLSPNLFNIFLHDLPEKFVANACAPVTLHDTKIGCMLYADDLVMLSESESGLQTSLEILSEYCQKWQLTVNLSKSKVIIFNITGKLVNKQFKYNNAKLDTVRNYCYLGIVFSSSGSFYEAIKSLKDKAMKAMFSILKTAHNCTPNISIKLYDSMIKPIINYSAEIWSSQFLDQVKNDNLFKVCEKPIIEKLQLKFAKWILGVHSKTASAAVRGELGQLPNLISQIKLGTKYYLRLLDIDHTSLAYKSLMECISLENTNCKSWLSGILNVINIVDTPYSATSVTQNKRFLVSDINNYFTAQYIENWHDEINRPGGKLRMYCTYKHEFKLEKYLLQIKSKDKRQYVTRLRVSSHNLYIEKGRYVRPKIPANQRFCQFCNNKSIDDEIHFVTSCKLNSELRDDMYSIINQFIPSFCTMDIHEKFHFLITCFKGDAEISQHFSEYVYNSFTQRKQNS